MNIKPEEIEFKDVTANSIAAEDRTKFISHTTTLTIAMCVIGGGVYKMDRTFTAIAT